MVRPLTPLLRRSEANRSAGNDSFGDGSTVMVVSERAERMRKEKEVRGHKEESEVHHDPYFF